MDIKSTVHLMTNPDSSLKAMVDVNLGDEFVIKGIRVVEGENGPFVSMPQKKVGNDYDQTFFPITKEAREQLHKSVLDAYDRKLTQQEEQKNEKGQSKGNKKGQSNDKQSANKSQKADDAPQQTDTELSQEGQDEQVEGGPAMSM